VNTETELRWLTDVAYSLDRGHRRYISMSAGAYIYTFYSVDIRMPTNQPTGWLLMDNQGIQVMPGQGYRPHPVATVPHDFDATA
jgi:hypothetical protein